MAGIIPLLLQTSSATGAILEPSVINQLCVNHGQGTFRRTDSAHYAGHQNPTAAADSGGSANGTGHARPGYGPHCQPHPAGCRAVAYGTVGAELALSWREKPHDLGAAGRVPDRPRERGAYH